jgi:hypothetical protein
MISIATHFVAFSVGMSVGLMVAAFCAVSGQCAREEELEADRRRRAPPPFAILSGGLTDEAGH